MRLDIRAISRLKIGPERTLIDEYLARANASARNIGLGPVSEQEIDPRTLKTKAAETEALLTGLDPGALVIALDETGRSKTSLELAQLIERARDDGVRQGVFLIGGADGHARELLPAGVQMIAFGKTTWPHKLVRVMLAEQIYRAISILSGSPYHREG